MAALPEVSCSRGGDVMKGLDGQVFKSDSDAMDRLKTGNAVVNAGGVDQVTSNAICMMESARGLQLKALSRAMSCESIWRAQISYVREAIDPTNVANKIKDLQNNIDGCIDYCWTGISWASANCGVWFNQGCYAKKMKGWFCRQFYAKVEPTADVASPSVNCSDDGTPSGFSQPMISAPADQSLSCMFNPKSAGCPGATAVADPAPQSIGSAVTPATLQKIDPSSLRSPTTPIQAPVIRGGGP
jgi:hypothetical protein